jgi:hypothetical protein
VGQLECFGNAANRTVGAVIDSPEINLAIFALLLNFAWEVLQAPMYAGMAGMPHAQLTRACLQATFGDMAIMLLGYGAVAAGAHCRRWIVAASCWQLAWFVAIGVAITAGIEWLATRGHWVQSWNYLPAMPLVPGTGIGLAPLLQWLLLPLLTVWFVRRQLAPAQGPATS